MSGAGAGRVRRIGLALALGGLMVVVDTTVTVVAVPSIVSGLDASLAAVQWVTVGYLLGIVAVIPLAGWASARFGARRVYLGALLTFVVFSALAGLAWDVASLAVFRFLQGLGGGLLNPVGQAIGLRAAPRDQRGRLMSLLVLPLLIGPALGPLLGGWLVDVTSWRWIFLINVPVGVVALLVCARVLPRDGSEPAAGGAGKVDWAGLGQLSGGAVLVVLGGTLLDQGGPVGHGGRAGRSGLVAAVALMVVGALLLVAFVRRARRVAEPLVDLRLLGHAPLRAGLGVLVCFGAAYFGSMAVLPLYVQGVNGDPATLVGVLALPGAVAVGVVAQVATRLVDRVPARRIVVTGTGVAAIGGLGLLVTTVTGAGYPWIVTAAALVSAGSGATIMPAMTIALRDLGHAETPRGTTLLALAQQLAAALGGAVVAVTLSALVSARMPGGGGVAGMLAADPGTRSALRGELAVAVGYAYAVPAVLLGVSFVLAVRGLRAGREPVPAV